MDEEILTCLKELGSSIQALGRAVASPKADAEKLETYAECLDISAETVRAWIRILKE